MEAEVVLALVPFVPVSDWLLKEEEDWNWSVNVSTD